jgi:hypothetical protein
MQAAAETIPYSQRRKEMNEAKRKRLESAGWKVGSADEFLGLTPEESAMARV